MSTQNRWSATNGVILDAISNGETDKLAAAGTDYTRTMLREDMFTPEIQPLQPISDSEFDRDLTEDLRKIEEIEPRSAGASFVSFQTTPENRYMKGSRYAIPFARIQTVRLQKDVDELRTYKYDLRKVLFELLIKDASAQVDERYIGDWLDIVTDTTTGNPNSPHRVTGKVQWAAYSGGLTHENFVDATKLLPTANARGEYVLDNHVVLMNNVTARDILKFKVDEIGDANVAAHFNGGLKTLNMWGMKILITNKQHLVPTNKAWFFCAPEFLGKGYQLYDWTAYVKREGPFIEQYAMCCLGMGIGNIAGAALADFDYGA